jgi:hypothetical protein
MDWMFVFEQIMMMHDANTPKREAVHMQVHSKIDVHQQIILEQNAAPHEGYKSVNKLLLHSL